MRETKQLTRSEFQVMQILWTLPEEGGFTGDILEHYADPKPAYTTLATFLKILHRKGFVRHRKRGNKLFYTPAVDKRTYAKIYFAPVRNTFFNGSIVEEIRFILNNEQLNDEERQALHELIG